MNNPTCETCRWWFPNIYMDDNPSGKESCHRFPPTAVALGASVVSVFPSTTCDDCCGEHQPKEPQS